MSDTVKNICVVRVSTSYWSDRDGVYQKKSIRVLKRKSSGVQILLEDAGNVGAESVIKDIVNLEECEDGVYIVHVANETWDFWTGHVEDCDLMLIPYEDDAPAEASETLGVQCIDGGKCNHYCTTKCFRRKHCSPFSDYKGPWEYC